jgi:gamma-D-glutamyl-L-lysine dipeptidyl-peptidase
MSIRFVDVAVANVWLSPCNPRDLDAASLSHPADVEGWLARLDNGEKGRIDLVGRLETQVLYGEPVWVVGEEDGWAEIRVPEQHSSKDEGGYPGWVPVRQLTFHPDYHQAWQTEPLAFVTAPRTLLRLEGSETVHPIAFMSKLPWLGEVDDEAIVLTPRGIVGRLPSEHITVSRTLPIAGGEVRVATAERFLGLPYLWGGTSSYGFDCSGLMYRIFESAGIRIPRDAGDQACYGERVPADELRPGDLVFFAHNEGRGKIHHVGMYVGNGAFIHSPRTGHPIRINRLSEDPYGQEFCLARRYHGSETFP